MHFRQLFDVIAKPVSIQPVVWFPVLPRGGLQVYSPPICPEILVKGYNRELHAETAAHLAGDHGGKALRG